LIATNNGAVVTGADILIDGWVNCAGGQRSLFLKSGSAGTIHVTGTAGAGSSANRLYALRIYDSNGATFDGEVMQGIRYGCTIPPMARRLPSTARSPALLLRSDAGGYNVVFNGSTTITNGRHLQ